MEIRIKSTGAVMLESELRQYLKDNNGPSFDRLTPEVLEAIDADPVFEGPQPTTSGPYEYVSRDGVEQVNGKWYTKYIIKTLDKDGQTAKDAEVATSVRNNRNRLLTECDWTQLTDSPVNKTAWATYRQELRDVPNQAGFPHNITWPNKPE